MLAEHLVHDAPHMEVTPEVQKIADEVCGDEQNLAVQAVLLMQHVAATVDHYSYSTDPNMPNCGIGDSAICRKQGGGCCTDLNSYFISLARARGIPARLNMGYRLQEKNIDKLVDAGYRCWVEYFIPNFGWLSADIVEADAPGGLGQDRWLSGLTARRIWLNSGREFKFEGMQMNERVNHMNIAYAEIDGKPARVLPEGKTPPQITRKVQFSEITAGTQSVSARK
jgi:transglutaminase-like putative cysteine protease